MQRNSHHCLSWNSTLKRNLRIIRARLKLICLFSPLFALNVSPCLPEPTPSLARKQLPVFARGMPIRSTQFPLLYGATPRSLVFKGSSLNPMFNLPISSIMLSWLNATGEKSSSLIWNTEKLKKKHFQKPVIHEKKILLIF